MQRGEAAFRKHLREHDQKAALPNEIRKSRNKARSSKNGYVWHSNQRTSKFESNALTIHSRMLKIPKD